MVQDTVRGRENLLCSVFSHDVVAISVLGRTPRDYREFTQPPEFEYAIY